jgi:sugar lactone lactonase YvrE
VVLSALALTAPAAALSDGTAAPGYEAETYATGFLEFPGQHWGPIGIAFDQSDRLYVGDAVDGNIYRFSPGGGTASSAARITPAPIGGLLEGLAISRSGRLYAARYSAGDVVEVDPATGRILRRVAQIPCATGLAFDPVSGDLFVSQNQCGPTVWRVSNLESQASAAKPYSFSPGVDGMAFDRSGALYAESDGTVIKIDGTASQTPGMVTSLASVPQGDGLAFGAHATGGPPYLVANRNNGVVTRVDFQGLGNSQTDIYTGGTRGDFSAVDSHGCLYITQSASIVRIRSADGTCSFEPSTPGVIPVQSAPPSPTKAPVVCRRLRLLKLRLHIPHSRRLRIARIYINGKQVSTVRGRSLKRTITLRRLPRKAFTLKVVEVTRRGHRIVRRRPYGKCYRGRIPAPTITL